MDTAPILFVIGVSGSGKSTIGGLLAERLEYPFFDGDDYHSVANIKKMSSGKALNDLDRQDWLERLNELALEHKDTGAVIVCSALKQDYRDILVRSLDNRCYKFIYLQGSMADISQRLASRKDHYMPAHLLKSQFEVLEEPDDAVVVSILKSPEHMVHECIKKVFSEN